MIYDHKQKLRFRFKKSKEKGLDVRQRTDQSRSRASADKELNEVLALPIKSMAKPLNKALPCAAPQKQIGRGLALLLIQMAITI